MMEEFVFDLVYSFDPSVTSPREYSLSLTEKMMQIGM